MIRPSLLFRLLTFALCLSCLGLFGCGQHGQNAPIAAQSAAPVPERPQATVSEEPPPLSAAKSTKATCTDPGAVSRSERNRASCYHLQPARTVVVAKGSTKKKKHNQSVVRTVGRCQPQSLIYARCRTGIKTCRLGDTSPVQWFACACKNGATTSRPIAGSVIVLAANSRRGMPTGHPAYVEEARQNPDGTWSLRISHTNYDRKCHLDLDATVLFYPRTMTASFESGHWSAWAKHLKVLGFIIQ